MTLDFCPPLAEMYRTRRAVGRSGRVFEGLKALSTVNNLLTIRSLMLDLKPARTLEVGMAYGGSALTFAQSHREAGHADGCHTAVDPFQSEVYDGAGAALLSRAGLGGLVEVVEEFSHAALPRFVGEGRRYQVIYLDGSHLFEDVFVDFYYSHALLEVGGVLLFDDSAQPNVAKAIRFVRRNYGEFYEELAAGPNDLRRRAARLLGRNQLTALRKAKDGRREWSSPIRDF